MSSEVLEWERRHFFEGSWVCVGRADDLGAPGDQEAVRVGTEGILLVRGTDGELRGYYNTCRHRGHELLSRAASPGTCNAIKCPYHAWVYGLDGALKGAPRFGDVAGFDKGGYPLIHVRVREWHGWIFVNPDGEAPDLDDLPGEPRRADRGLGAGPHLRRGAARVRGEGELEDHDRELSGVLSLPEHPSRVVQGDAGRQRRVLPAHRRRHRRLDGAHGLRRDDVVHRREPGSELPRRSTRSSDARSTTTAVFPNLLISLHPDYIMTHRLDPLAPGEMWVECSFLFPPEAKERSGLRRRVCSEFWDITESGGLRGVRIGVPRHGVVGLPAGPLRSRGGRGARLHAHDREGLRRGADHEGPRHRPRRPVRDRVLRMPRGRPRGGGPSAAGSLTRGRATALARRRSAGQAARGTECTALTCGHGSDLPAADADRKMRRRYRRRRAGPSRRVATTRRSDPRGAALNGGEAWPNST